MGGCSVVLEIVEGVQQVCFSPHVGKLVSLIQTRLLSVVQDPLLPGPAHLHPNVLQRPSAKQACRTHALRIAHLHQHPA
jgi:hypothetical protein